MSSRAIISRENASSANTRSGAVPQTGLHPTSSIFQQALAYHQQNRLSEAENLYRQILAVDTNHPGAMHFLGMVALEQKNLPEAIRLIECSLARCSTKPAYFNNHGVALKEAGQLENAKHAFEKALALKPNYPDALSNLGFVSIILKQPENQIEHFLKSALQIQPGHLDALRHFSELRARQERYSEALELLKQLHTIVPANAELEHRMGCLAGDAGYWTEAKQYFQKAAILPGGKLVWKWKHLWYCPTFFENEEQINEYWEHLNCDLDTALAEKSLYDWRTLVYDGFTHSFNLPHLNRCCKDVLEKFAQLFAPSFPFERPTYRPGKKIRVGFLVTPGHEGGFLRMASGLIERIAPEAFEPVLLYNETTAKKYEGKFKRGDLERVPYSWNFEKAVRTIREARCDVIYYWKAAADVWNTFLPMCRLAPVQCTSWSTHVSSGIPHVDYYVSWDKAEIQGNPQEQYTERLFLFDIKPYFERKLTDIPGPATRLELGLPETGAIYFCPHRPAKYHPMFDDYLRQILQRDPTGYIVIRLGKQSPLTDKFIARMCNTIGDELFRRVIVIPQQHVKDYYKYLSVATVVLHSPIYSGEITTVDAFLYGVPCVAQTGKWLSQRYTSAFYDVFGIVGPAASNKEEYITEAVKLGTNSEYRRKISQAILANHDSFFENEHSIRSWERFFTQVTRQDSTGEQASPSVVSSSMSLSATAVPMKQLEINVAYGCNLNCNYCSHFCDRMSGLAPVEELVDDFRAWHRKLTPMKIRLIGGEPLLHPELDTIIHEVKKYWPLARIDVVTNGILLPKHLEILSTLKKLDGHVFISRHFDDEKYLREFDVAMRCLKDSGVAFTLYTSDRQWRKCYEIDGDGVPIPYDSAPDNAWKNCRTKNFCPTIWGNRLWKCQHLAWSAHAVRSGKLPKSWQAACDYEPLSPESTTETILAHLASESVPGCRICPESYEFLSLSEKRSPRMSGVKPGFAASQ